MKNNKSTLKTFTLIYISYFHSKIKCYYKFWLNTSNPRKFVLSLYTFLIFNEMGDEWKEKTKRIWKVSDEVSNIWMLHVFN